MAEQRYLIWKFCHEQSAAWQAEKSRIQDEANRKRSVAAKAQPRTETETGKTVFDKPPMSDEQRYLIWKGQDESQVVEQSVLPPDSKSEPGKQAKAAASKTNKGAVARGDKLAKERPDLAKAIRLGTMAFRSDFRAVHWHPLPSPLPWFGEGAGDRPEGVSWGGFGSRGGSAATGCVARLPLLLLGCFLPWPW